MTATFATYINFLSRSSLALYSLFVGDPARDILQTRVDQLHDWVNWATALVGVGVAMEAVEPLHDLVAWIKFKKRESVHSKEIAEFVPFSKQKPKYRESHPWWLKWLSRIGVVVVVIGVIGEWRCGAKLEDAQNAVHKYDVGKITAADQKAGEAKVSADAVAKEYDDLLKKYEAAGREITELKAAKLPRRLSSSQKAIFRQAVISLKGNTLDISCGIPGGDPAEPLDFEQDFLDALGIRANEKTVRKVPVNVGYLVSCNTLLGGVSTIPPIQILAGSDRTYDADTLIKALVEMGINKKQITKKASDNKELLDLMIGPKAP